MAAEIDCAQTFYFAYDPRGDFEKFEYLGFPTFGDSKFPDFNERFIRSVEELDKDTPMALHYVESDRLPAKNETFAEVWIEDIRLIAGFSSAVLEVVLVYEMPGETLRLTGTNKMNVGFTKRGSLYKALKNGHFLFISAICGR